MADGNGAATEVKVEKGVPLPPEARGRRTDYKLPFAELAIGDSFIVAGDAHSLKLRKRVANAAIYFGVRQNPKRTFTIRAVEGGFRCWRIA